MKKAILLILVSDLFSAGAPAQTIIKDINQPQYIPGQVIVKLKEEETPRALFKQRYSTRKRKHTGILSRLKTQYKLKDAEPVFKGLHTSLKLKKLTQNKLRKQILAKFRDRGLRVPPHSEKKRTDLLPIYLLKTNGDVSAICEQINKEIKNGQAPEIEYAQPNYIYGTTMVPNDTYWDSPNTWGQDPNVNALWGLEAINCEEAWDIADGNGVIVAVIDSGVDYNHPDLAANIIKGPDYGDGDHDPMDVSGHGTHVAGTIAAIGNNGIGIIGVAPKVKILAVKGFSDSGESSSGSLSNSIIYAVSNGASVINNSWGPDERSLSDFIIKTAIDYAYDDYDCVVVFAAGNHNDNVEYYFPASYSKTIAVASVDSDNLKSNFSNWGEKIDVTAPGGDSGDMDTTLSGQHYYVNILSTRAAGTDMYLGAPNYTPEEFVVGDNYYRSRGTSMAAPHVSGVAALLRSLRPELTNEEVRNIMGLFSADDLGVPGKDNYYGYGRVNAYQALEITNSNTPPVFINLSNKIAPIGSLLEFQVEAKAPWGGLNYFAEDLPPGATFDPNTQIFSWTPTKPNKGTYDVTFVAKGTQRTGVGSVLITTLDINEVQITEDPGAQISPAIYEDKIVWQDDRNGNNDIYMYNPNSIPSEIQITFNGSNQKYPAIYEDRVVWADYRNSDRDIYMHDFSSIPSEIQITSGNNHQTFPAVDGDIIVWQDYRVDRDIYMYDITTDINAPVCTAPNWQFYPAINGDRIVWQDRRTQSLSGYDIYMYDISISTETPICTTSMDQRSPAIYGDVIAWEDLRNGNNDIYMYDIVTGLETPICTASGNQASPAIYGDRIVWQDNRNGNNDIYMYNLATRQEIQITFDSYNQTSPDIYGDIITYEDDQGGNDDIYMTELTFAPQISSVSAMRVSVDDIFIIDGENFGDTQGTSTVEFGNGAIATIENWLDTEITCRVPSGAQTGKIKVISDNGPSNGSMIVVNSPFSPADLDYDNDVDAADLEVFADSWLMQEGDYKYNPACNFNDDDIINFLDYAVFAGE